LAGWTEERTSLALKTADDPAAMVWTGLALLPVDQVMVLVGAFPSVGREEIPHTGSPTGDRGLEHCLHRVIELKFRGLAEVTDVPIRMQAGAKQNLVRVDIPDSRNDFLPH